ncbi:MAG: hypothetical protein LW630_10940 [Saprospiraceae bacterium]|nr:hypothetical protein [Saprospiraceae bacterium]
MAQSQFSRITGVVSYKSSRNIYAKFSSTREISEGDTLFLKRGNEWNKVLIVRKKSTTSCITESIALWSPELGDSVSYFSLRKIETQPKEQVSVQLPQESILQKLAVTDSIIVDTIQTQEILKENWNGRITLSTNANISGVGTANHQRIRFAVSLKANNIRQSAWSAEIYSTYRHRYGLDNQNASLLSDTRLFTLSLTYNPNSWYTISAGRRINNQVANIGSIDGIQSEFKTRLFNIGAFAGTRPDFRNFGFNPNLPQYGVYLAKTIKSGTGMAQTSLAFSEQQYYFRTDRRFLYLQHNNNILPSINLFLSSEIDLYKKVNYVTSNSASLTSIYANLRYRIKRNLSASASYDQRRNIIYYESYQTFIDQLLAQETRQGWRFQMNYTPFKGITLNSSVFYRYQGSGNIPTKNYIIATYINNIPGIGSNLQLSVNFLETSYFKGTIFSGRMSKNIFKGRCNIELQYRKVDYTFFNTESLLSQHIGGLNFFVNVTKKTALSCSYEGTFEPGQKFHRYFITLTQRIKN